MAQPGPKRGARQHVPAASPAGTREGVGVHRRLPSGPAMDQEGGANPLGERSPPHEVPQRWEPRRPVTRSIGVLAGGAHPPSQAGSAGARHLQQVGQQNLHGAQTRGRLLAADHRPAPHQSMVQALQHEARDPQEAPQPGTQNRLHVQYGPGGRVLLPGDRGVSPGLFHSQCEWPALAAGSAANGLVPEPLLLLRAHEGVGACDARTFCGGPTWAEIAQARQDAAALLGTWSSPSALCRRLPVFGTLVSSSTVAARPSGEPPDPARPQAQSAQGGVGAHTGAHSPGHDRGPEARPVHRAIGEAAGGRHAGEGLAGTSGAQPQIPMPAKDWRGWQAKLSFSTSPSRWRASTYGSCTRCWGRARTGTGKSRCPTSCSGICAGGQQCRQSAMAATSSQP